MSDLPNEVVALIPAGWRLTILPLTDGDGGEVFGTTYLLRSGTGGLGQRYAARCSVSALEEHQYAGGTEELLATIVRRLVAHMREAGAR